MLKKVKEEEEKIKIRHSPRYFRYVERRITSALRQERINGLKTKNKKLYKLASNKPKVIKDKYDKARYPPKFVESVIRSFHEKQNKPKVDEVNEEQKPFILIRLPYCEKNETSRRTNAILASYGSRRKSKPCLK